MNAAQRYAEREQLTQALAYAATLQDRGWACLFVGASFLILRAREDGVFARLQRPRAIDLGILEQIRSRTGMARLLVEPALAGDLVHADGTRTPWRFDPEDGASPFEALGWRPSSRGIAHGKTLLLDLAPSLADIVASFSTAARRNVRKAEAVASVSYSSRRFADATARDVEEIHALYREFLGERSHLPDEWSFRERLFAHFGQRGFFVTAHDASGLLGVVLLLVHDAVAYYYAAFSRADARAARVPTGLVHAAIATAREAGCDLWDFVGIRDERTPARNAKWDGFTAFKLRFGGVPIVLPLAYEG